MVRSLADTLSNLMELVLATRCSAGVVAAQARQLVAMLVVTIGLSAFATAWADDEVAEPEPDDYITVSDDSGSPAAAPQPEDDSATEEPADEVSADLETESDEADPDTITPERIPRVIGPPKHVDVDSAETHDAQITDEASIDEVAPIEGPPTGTSKRTTSASTDDVSPTYPSTGAAPTHEANVATKSVRPAIEPATFRGVVAGETTRDELLEAWGDDAVRSSQGGNELTYHFKPFKQVVVKLAGDTVDTLVIHLDELAEPTPLAQQLQLDDVQATTIHNAKGQKLGMAFPERGVLFAFAAQAPIRVAQVVLEPVNSQPFVTRAEELLYDRPADALADVRFALEIDPQYDRAHAVHAKVLCQMADYAAAQTAIERAVELAPAEVEYQLILAQALLGQGDFPGAIAAAKQVTGKQSSAYLQAQAELVLGHAQMHQSPPDFAQALTHHTAAIKHAQQVSAASAGPVRRRMKELAIDAHLAVASDIARGNWQKKETIVPQWIDRAKAISEHIITKEDASEVSRLWVYAGALDAFAGLKNPPDANETIDAMSNLGRRLMEAEGDATRRELLHYQLAGALADGMTIAQARRNTSAAVQLGQQAVKHFEQAKKTCGQFADYSPRLAEVYYRLGALHAIDQEEHLEAVAWYRQAVPLLLPQAESAEGTDAVRLGEMLVSIAISYWETEDREQALELTAQGAELIAAAVKAGHAKNEALSVPYGNMAAMHEALGASAKAKEFSEMASRATTRR